MYLNINHAQRSYASIFRADRFRYSQAAKEEWTRFASTETPLPGENQYSLNVYREGEPVGCLVLQQHEEGLCLKLFCVNDQMQQVGLERELLSYAERHAREKGADKLIVFAPYIGISFYVRNGYQQTGNFHHDDDEGAYFFRMEKDLVA
jgi:GNAT superfamily N-acetyltransferase